MNSTDDAQVEWLRVEFGKLRLTPDDVLVITFPERLSREQREIIHARIRRVFGDQRTRVMVLDGGVTFEVISRPNEEAGPRPVASLCPACGGAGTACRQGETMACGRCGGGGFIRKADA